MRGVSGGRSFQLVLVAGGQQQQIVGAAAASDSIMRARWVSTVFTLMPRSAAISLLLSPLPICRRISRWRGDSAAMPVGFRGPAWAPASWPRSAGSGTPGRHGRHAGPVPVPAARHPSPRNPRRRGPVHRAHGRRRHAWSSSPPGCRVRAGGCRSALPGRCGRAGKIHQHHVRCMLQGQLQRLFGVARFGHQLHVGKPATAAPGRREPECDRRR